MTLEVLALAELAAADLADEIPSLFVGFNVQLEVFLSVGPMLAARNSAGEELSGVEEFVGLEGLHVGGAVAADVAEHLLLGIVNQDVVAQPLFPLEALAAMRTDVRCFRGVLGLVDEQGSSSGKADAALQTKEGLA